MIIPTNDLENFPNKIWVRLFVTENLESLKIEVFEGKIDSLSTLSSYFETSHWEKLINLIKENQIYPLEHTLLLHSSKLKNERFLAYVYFETRKQIQITIRNLENFITPIRSPYELTIEESSKLWTFGFWEFYPTTGEALWSSKVFEIFGYDLDTEPSYENLLKIIHPDDRAVFEHEFKNHLINKVPFDLEHRIIPVGKDPIWVRCRCTTKFDETGKPINSFGITVDIDHYKNTELSLIKEKSEFEFLFNNMNQGVVYQNKAGEIIRANKAAENLLGLSIEQLQGKKSIDPDWYAMKADGSPFPGEEHPAMVSLKTGESIYNVEMGVYHPLKKEHVWILVSAQPEFLGDEKDPYRVFTSFTDITELKKNQIALKQTQSELDQKIKELETQKNLQNLLLSISSNYILFDSNDFERKINNSLAELGAFIKADRFYIFEYDYTNKVCSNTYEWCAEGIHPEMDNLQNVPFELFPEWLEKHGRGEKYEVQNVQSLPESSNTFQLLNPQGIKSIITLPIMHHNNCLGFIGLDFVTDYHIPGTNENVLLDIFAKLISNVFIQLDNQTKVERYSKIVENSKNEIYIFDYQNYKFINANNAALSNIGYSFSELKEFTPWDIKPEFSQQQFELFIQPLKNNEIESLNFVTYHKRKDESKYPVKISLRKLEIGNKLMFVAIIEDVTNEFFANKALEDSEKRFRKIFEENATPMLLYKLDSLEIIDMNKAALEFYGVQKSNLGNLRVSSFTCNQEDLTKKVNQLKEFEHSKIETKHKTLDNQIIDVEVFSTSINYNYGAVVHEIIFDISRRNKYFQTIESQNKRFREIAWMQSHVLRAPIARILGLIMLLKENGLNQDESDMAFREIENSAKELDQIVHEMSAITQNKKEDN